MNRTRRLLLFCPLALLTLFFAACGWRVWHLPMNDESVWLVIPSHIAAQNNKNKLPISLATGPSGFGTNQTTVLSQWDEQNSRYRALPTRSLQLLRLRYPQFRLKNHLSVRPDSDLDNNRYVCLGKVHFRNRFSAVCRIEISTRPPHCAQFGTETEMLVFARSVLPFSDSNWRVAEVRDMSYTMN